MNVFMFCFLLRDDDTIINEGEYELDASSIWECSTIVESVPDTESVIASVGNKVTISTQTFPEIPAQLPLNTTLTYGPHQFLSGGDEEYLYLNELKFISETKVICSLELLLNRFQGSCKHPGCIHDVVVRSTLCGTSAIISWICPAGHQGKFCTSGEINGVLANNLQASAAVLLSGNNFAKIEKFAKFFNLAFVSRSTFLEYNDYIVFL